MPLTTQGWIFLLEYTGINVRKHSLT